MKSDATTEMAFFVLLAKLGSLSATARAMASVPPPGADPTSMRTGLTGQLAESCAWACAWACQGSTAAPHTAAMESR